MEPTNDNAPSTTLGDRLRACREACGLTQNQVATYVDCDASTLSKIEVDRFDPSVDLLRKIFLVYAAHAPVTTSTLSANYLLFGMDGPLLYDFAMERFGPQHAAPED